MTGRRLATLLGTALLLALSLVSPAAAATKTVTLSNQGPSPTSLTVAAGDTVRFVNSDSVSHTVARTSGAWTFTRQIAAGASATTAAFTKPGTYAYSDSFTLVAVPQTRNGSIVVPVPPSPSPRPSASATPKPSAPPSPSVRPTASPTASPTTPAPTASASGVAIAPGITIGGIAPSASPAASAVPGPDIASPQPGRSASPATTVAYGGKSGIVQSSPHRYGLPALLALVGIVGVLSLLVRFLLAQPEARA